MGGKALNKYGVHTERKNTIEFNQIGMEVSNVISDKLKFYTFIPNCYGNKETHGDLDLLVQVHYHVNWREFITQQFHPHAINSNGNVHSFDYKDFQVDIIPIPYDKWENACTYFSYDPIGNIMGKTYHKFGLSYGWEGLYYKFRTLGGGISDDILISRDIRKIFEFGGYNYDRFLVGFNSLDEIFEFAVTSKYFNANIFQMDELNAVDRKRNRKRVTYHQFIEYINNTRIANKIPNNHTFNPNKDSYISVIDSTFPEAKLIEKIAKLREQDRINKIISQKFNGDLVISWLPKLVGKELGNAIVKFKSALGDDYKTFVLNGTYDEIRNKFFQIYEE